MAELESFKAAVLNMFEAIGVCAKHKDNGDPKPLETALIDYVRRAKQAEADRDVLADVVCGWVQADECDPQVRGECVREARERTERASAALERCGKGKKQ